MKDCTFWLWVSRFGLRYVEVVDKGAEKKKEMQKSSHGRKPEREEEEDEGLLVGKIYDAEGCRSWFKKELTGKERIMGMDKGSIWILVT